MAGPVERSDGLATRVIVGVVVLVAAWILIRALLGFVFSLLRVVLFVTLFAIIAWVVLVGPSDGRADRE